MNWMWKVGLGYLLAINLLAFVQMGLDKRKSQRGEWRISERQLFLPALLGGTVGAILGMRHFRHKTKHWYFWYGLPALLVVQLGGGAALWWFVLSEYAV